MNFSNRMPLQRPPNMSPQQLASTPTNQRFFIPRFGHSSIPSYPRPRSSASKPNPDCSPLLEDPFSTRPCNYPEEDSMRNNFGSSRDENSYANEDSSFQSPNSSAYYSCYDSFVDSPAISPDEGMMNNPRHFNANTPERFQQQNANTPQRFQQQNAHTPQRFQQQNENTYQHRFQQQNEDTYQRFQQQDEDTYQRFQPQNANDPRRFQPQNANNGFQKKFPNKRNNFVKNKPYPLKKNPVNNPQNGTKLQVVPGWDPAWQSERLSQGHCSMSILGRTPSNWFSENQKFFSSFSTTTHMETQKKNSSSRNADPETPTPPTTVVPIEGVNVPSGTDTYLFRATETRSTGREGNVPLGADTSNPVVMDLDSSVRGTGSDALADDRIPVTEAVIKKKLKKQRQKERKKLEKVLIGILIAGAGGATEEAAKASTSGATSQESHPHDEESRKRGSIAGDTPEMASRKRRRSNKAAREAKTLRAVCKDDSTEMTSADEDHITSEIDNSLINGTIPTCQVHKTFLQSNGLNIVCKDKDTADALEALINQLPGPTKDHPGYLAMAPGDSPPIKRFFAWFPGNRQPKDNIKLLGTCNKGLDIRKITIKAVFPGDGGSTLVLGVDNEMLNFLKARTFSLFCGARGSIQLMEATLKNTKTETSS